MCKRTFKLSSGNQIELHYVSGIGMSLSWLRKPPSKRDFAEFRRKRDQWVRAVLPSDRSFIVIADSPDSLGRLEICRRVADRSAA